MNEQREFAGWVEPLAALYGANRTALVAYARSLPAGTWTLPSPDPGWTCKDLLAHVAGDTGQNLHAALRAIIAGGPVPPELFTDFDRRNARDVEERRGRSIEQLIDELVRAGEETQRLLAQLTEADARRHEPGLRGDLPDALRALASHDATHLEQLRAATSAHRLIEAISGSSARGNSSAEAMD
jgi:hypothetical protein